MILFLKALVRGGAAGDLFAVPVAVKGHTTKAGVLVAPHTALRHKHTAPAAAAPDLFAWTPPAPAAPAPPAPAPAIPSPITLDAVPAAHGLPANSIFVEGKGPFGRGRWRVDVPGVPNVNYSASKDEAVTAARQGIANHAHLTAAKAKAAADDVRIAGKLRAGVALSASDLADLDLRPGRSAEFGILSPIAQRLLGVSKARVREAMGDALRLTHSDMGTPKHFARPEIALANVAAFMQANQPPLVLLPVAPAPLAIPSQTITISDAASAAASPAVMPGPKVDTMQISQEREGTLTRVSVICPDAATAQLALAVFRKGTSNFTSPLEPTLTLTVRCNKREAQNIVAGLSALRGGAGATGASVAPVSTWRHRIMLRAHEAAAPEHVTRDGEVLKHTGYGKTFRISEDDPSVHGSHLLGHEGESARFAYYA